jgi:hypothetical protein
MTSLSGTKTYRVCTYEVLHAGTAQEQTTLVDIIEFETALDLNDSGKNVFHLLDEVRANILEESDKASAVTQ